MSLTTSLKKLASNQPLTVQEQTKVQELIQVLEGKTLEDITLDNLLVQQKDVILNTMRREPDKALAQLQVVKPLWDTYKYTYKYNEIMTRIKTYKESLEF